ncbi:MAG: hypothetical protein Q7W30_09915 [Coriobacteriia bacterium]|nr:hypothetical protein [Coriobacteriia bacterium]
MQSAELKEMVVAELGGALATLGFERRTGLGFTVAVGRGVVGRIALTQSYVKSERAFWVLPMAGVRYEAAAKIVDEVLGYKSGLASPTIQTALVHLVAGRDPADAFWVFGEDADARAAALADLMRCVDEAALPYMRSLATADAILEALRERDDAESRFQEAVLLWATGARDDGVAGLRALAEAGESAEAASTEEFYAEAAAEALEVLGG